MFIGLNFHFFKYFITAVSISVSPVILINSTFSTFPDGLIHILAFTDGCDIDDVSFDGGGLYNKLLLNAVPSADLSISDNFCPNDRFSS